jgi:hypothetical protein
MTAIYIDTGGRATGNWHRIGLGGAYNSKKLHVALRLMGGHTKENEVYVMYEFDVARGIIRSGQLNLGSMKNPFTVKADYPILSMNIQAWTKNRAQARLIIDVNKI